MTPATFNPFPRDLEFERSAKKYCQFLFLAPIVVSIFSSMLDRAKGADMSFQISSTGFAGNQMIPKKFTCDGTDVSPALSWEDAPVGTRSLALIMDDPDAPAGTWVHWVMYNIPAETKDLPEGVAKQEQLPDGSLQGRNDFRKTGYGGPCPPPGKPHRYYFKLYALDAKLNLNAGASKADVEEAMKGHVLAKAELIGRFAH
jgi:Raf kinase inhibitor-like YbhB/YbcL family protein